VKPTENEASINIPALEGPTRPRSTPSGLAWFVNAPVSRRLKPAATYGWPHAGPLGQAVS